MQIIDGGIEGWNEFDESIEMVMSWPDMLDDSYECTLLFDHNRPPEPKETFRIFHKYYRGRKGFDRGRGQRYV